MRRPGSVDLILGATIVIWAFNITVTRYVLTHGFQPLAYGAIRYGAAALLALAATLALEHSLRVGGRRTLALIAAAALFLLVNQVSFVYALKLGTATTVALILGMTPIFAAILSSVAGLERLDRRFWIATAIGCAGVALVALGSGGGLSSDLGGDLLAIVLAMSWAAYSVTIAPLMRQYSPYRISAVVLLVMCVPFVALSSPQIASQDYASLGWPGLAGARIRDRRAALPDQPALVHGHPPRRPVAGDAVRERPAVRRGDLRGPHPLRAPALAPDRRRRDDPRRDRPRAPLAPGAGRAGPRRRSARTRS